MWLIAVIVHTKIDTAGTCVCDMIYLCVAQKTSKLLYAVVLKQVCLVHITYVGHRLYYMECVNIIYSCFKTFVYIHMILCHLSQMEKIS